jgi:hypothetical protein
VTPKLLIGMRYNSCHLLSTAKRRRNLCEKLGIPKSRWVDLQGMFSIANGGVGRQRGGCSLKGREGYM